MLEVSQGEADAASSSQESVVNGFLHQDFSSYPSVRRFLRCAHGPRKAARISATSARSPISLVSHCQSSVRDRDSTPRAPEAIASGD